MVKDLEETSPNKYEFASNRGTAMALTGSVLEVAQHFKGAHLPEPFDVANHSGNMAYGIAVSLFASALYLYKMNPGQWTISDEQRQLYNKVLVPIILGTVILMNCTVETQWGIDNLPFARILDGTTPDILDTIYSVGWTALSTALMWKKEDNTE